MMKTILQHHFSGKLLLSSEIPLTPMELKQNLQQQLISPLPSIVDGTCQRCGNNQMASFPCIICQTQCSYCRHCIDMGRVTSCQPLYKWSGADVLWEPSKRSRLTWDGTLSSPQQEASDQVVRTIVSKGSLLVWAVCGAGKTEVTFKGIDRALMRGDRVCFATPRTDVVLELAPRLRRAFKGIEVAALYGGGEDMGKATQLVVTTTHQLYRFKQAYDTMIVDEIDAFPYSYDRSLQHAVQAARKSTSALIQLTATPSKHQIRTHPFIRIPARFHGYPLPLPEFKWCGNWQKSIEKERIPRVILQWVNQRLMDQTPIMLFFPSIKHMLAALPLFQQLNRHCLSVHAEDRERKEKVMKLREGRCPLLLTTTILERGVTISGVDVGVVGAEDDQFTESALVQIAGRVGRKKESPAGNVTFFHFGKSLAMERAYLHIDDMNNEGRRKGLLHP
ncbi:hypothetical protein Q75_15325 [Bacillus coahuilensis p1.1.43]|uniref:Helicase n=2 Tax=Bacillus coahuilensis TaxID=408580 RepID=A0A147K4V5_9BACI|nr:DEAD/DEAH box helicase [Bacillus coahuilensis]KUP04472.1 hypothetical protein Q75_15325 [Bacillus coahuilensis p1.1.43]